MAKYITLDNLSTFLTQLKNKTYPLKSWSKSTLDAASMGTTSNRQYAVGYDKSGYLSVNVPWTDADTKNTAGTTSSQNKLYLIGCTAEPGNASSQTYCNSKVYATNGALVADSFKGVIKGTSLASVNDGYSDLNFAFYSNITGCDTTVSTNGNRYAGTANSYGFPVSNNANAMLWIGAHSGNYGHQIGFSSDGRIYNRYISNGSFPTTVNGGSWKKLAFTSDIPTTLKNPNSITFSSGTFATKTYDGSAAVTVNIPTTFNHIGDATYVNVESDSITRKVIVSTIKPEGYISRATFGLKNSKNNFGSAMIGVGSNDGGTTFTDYYFSTAGGITDSKGNTYAKTTDIKTTFTGTAASHDHTFTGTAHKHTFTGTAASHNHTFTGTAASHDHTFTGTAHKHTFTGTAASHDHTLSGNTGSSTLSISYSAGELTITTSHTHGLSTGTVSSKSLTPAGTLNDVTATGAVGSKSLTPAGTIANTSVTPAGTLNDVTATGAVGSKSLTPAGTLS